ncbi:restriction endonuclease [Nocardia sp. NPDC049707]|uniref:restriction endonuclease n=1 Tax=Nocardia sp. NPDC049707 TaxID=3154735 RepID=UPI003443675F
MVSHSALQGYLLEEALAWLLRSSGYRLLVHADQDPVELVDQGGDLRVRGRGALHQADVLGEFTFTPAFSMPVRLFVEAKYRKESCDLPMVRNAHGVVHDVNENYMTGSGTRPRQRYKYSYVLFSASGFTADAQKYALAHHISLVDLSGPTFDLLRGIIGTTGNTLDAAQKHLPETGSSRKKVFPVNWMRAMLRRHLGTAPSNLLPQPGSPGGEFDQKAGRALAEFAETLVRRSGSELLLGFPAAPFILPLATENYEKFIEFGAEQPDHKVRIRRDGTGVRAEWKLSPAEAPDAYELTFKLPEQIEDWIGEVADEEISRAVKVKKQFLSEITLYRMNGASLRVYQLRYEPGSLSRMCGDA